MLHRSSSLFFRSFIYKNYYSSFHNGTGILLLNMGGPENLDEVGPFLHNLFTDEDIIQIPFQKYTGPFLAKRRTPNIRKLYSEIGNCSPITKYTKLQGEKTCKLLDKISPNSAPHKYYIGFRYAGPKVSDALDQMKNDGIKRVIAFSQYPQFSCTTTGSSLNHLWKTIKEKNMEELFTWSIIDRWPIHNKFINAITHNIQQGLQEFSDNIRDNVIILFSAHSLPLKTVFKGDQYPAEVAATVYQVMNKLKFSHKYMLTWQSQVGKIPWLAPQTDKIIEELGKTKKSLLIVPIAFTSDHIETLSEIDIEFKEVAKKSGIKEFIRAPSLNDNPLAIEAFAEIIKDHIDNKQLYSNQYTFRCPGCTKKYCRTIINPDTTCTIQSL